MKEVKEKKNTASLLSYDISFLLCVWHSHFTKSKLFSSRCQVLLIKSQPFSSALLEFLRKYNFSSNYTVFSSCWFLIRYNKQSAVKALNNEVLTKSTRKLLIFLIIDNSENISSMLK